MARAIPLAIVVALALSVRAIAQHAPAGEPAVPAAVRGAARQVQKACSAWRPDLELREKLTGVAPMDSQTAYYLEICTATNPVGLWVGIGSVIVLAGLTLIGAITRFTRALYWLLYRLRRRPAW